MGRPKLMLSVLCLAAILVTLISQNTLAYYTVIGRATNVVTSGGIELKIHETTENGDPFPTEGVYILPGQVVSKRVTVENRCDQPFWLRVRLVYGITGSTLPYEELLQVELNHQDWTLREDGFVYYNHPLQPGQLTEPVFTHVRVAGQEYDLRYIDSTLTLTVHAYAVQSVHNSADHPWEAAGWPPEH